MQVASMDMARTFGAELELIDLSHDAAKNALTRAGFTAVMESYNHRTRPHWKVVHDGSVTDERGRNGCEVVSPVLSGIDGILTVQNAAVALRGAGGTVNKSCGFHVHHGASDLTINGWRVFFKRYLRAEAALDALMVPDRRANANRYCLDLRTRIGGRSDTGFGTGQITMDEAFALIDAAPDIETIRDTLLGGCACQTAQRCNCRVRFKKINLGLYWARGTVEFRHHGGTLSPNKVAAWVLLTQAMLTRANDVPSERLLPVAVDMERLLWGLHYQGDLDPVVMRHFRARTHQMEATRSQVAAYRIGSL